MSFGAGEPLQITSAVCESGLSAWRFFTAG